MQHGFPLLGRFTRNVGDGPNAWLAGDSLIVDCRSCDLIPIPGSGDCIGCMVRVMCDVGGADRIVLRTGMDTEISGRAGRVLKDISSMRRWSIPSKQLKGHCRTCQYSRSEIMTKAWDSFPDGSISELRASLISQRPERDGCGDCIASTIRALDQMEESIGDAIRRTGGQRRAVP